MSASQVSRGRSKVTFGSYERERTGLLFVDLYNDFLSNGGKFWPMVEGVAKEVGLLDNLRIITAAIRKSGIRIFIVPHHRWEQGDYKGWDHPTPYQLASGDPRAVFPDHSGFGETLANTPIPILSLNGDHDVVFPVENWYALNRKWKSLHITTFPQAGHGPHHQYPEAVGEYINTFVRTIK